MCLSVDPALDATTAEYTLLAHAKSAWYSEVQFSH